MDNIPTYLLRGDRFAPSLKNQIRRHCSQNSLAKALPMTSVIQVPT